MGTTPHEPSIDTGAAFRSDRTGFFPHHLDGEGADRPPPASRGKVAGYRSAPKGRPDRTQQIANCFENQFEKPVLFYALVVLAIITKRADLLFVVMEWLFVASRVAHAYVFTTSNYVPLHGQFFIAGTILLLFMWEIFALRILAGPLSGAL